MLERYADAYGQLIVVCRADAVQNHRIPRIIDSRIGFSPQPNLRSASIPFVAQRAVRSITACISEADVVVARVPSILGLLAASIAKRLRVPTVLEVVANALESNAGHGSPLGRIVGVAEHVWTKHEVRTADTVIYITKRYLQSVYPTSGRSFVCPNVLVPEPMAEVLQARLKRFKSRGNRSIGLVGSLDVDYKGHNTALRTLAVLIDKYGHTDLTLEFVGPGCPQRWQSKATALGVDHAVRFKGALAPGAEVARWMDTIDILLQPSRTEAQGRAIIEAMSRACPVVASNVGGIPELLDSTVLAHPDAVEAMARLCDQLLARPQLYAETSATNWRTAFGYATEVIEPIRFVALRSVVDPLGKPPRNTS